MAEKYPRLKDSFKEELAQQEAGIERTKKKIAEAEQRKETVMKMFGGGN